MEVIFLVVPALALLYAAVLVVVVVALGTAVNAVLRARDGDRLTHALKVAEAMRSEASSLLEAVPDVRCPCGPCRRAESGGSAGAGPEGPRLVE